MYRIAAVVACRWRQQRSPPSPPLNGKISRHHSFARREHDFNLGHVPNRLLENADFQANQAIYWMSISLSLLAMNQSTRRVGQRYHQQYCCPVILRSHHIGDTAVQGAQQLILPRSTISHIKGPRPSSTLATLSRSVQAVFSNGSKVSKNQHSTVSLQAKMNAKHHDRPC